MENTKYMFIPKHVDGFELRTRVFNTQEVSEMFSIDTIDSALDTGETIMFKGNEYYVDIL